MLKSSKITQQKKSSHSSKMPKWEDANYVASMPKPIKSIGVSN